MIPFSPPRMDQKVVEEVSAALLSGWITTGPRTKKLEQKLSEYTGAKKTLCVSSGSAGLELILRWFGLKEGDEVIVPAYTYAATANVVVHCGAKVVFVDVNKHDFNISLSAIENAITVNTKVIMAVDLGGYPCDYDQIHQIIEQKKELFKAETPEQKGLNRILVLSDAAHSIGAEYQSKKAGSFTDITVFSFHAVKNLTTAEGGAVSLNLPSGFDHDKIYQDLNRKCLHGQSKDALAKTQIGNWRYDILEAGYKYNMTDIQAAIGLVELERYETDMLVRRKEIFEKYTAAFKCYYWANIPEYQSGNKISSYHLYLLRIKNISEQERDAIIEEIFKQEVAVNVHYIPLPMMSFYKGLGYRIENYPQTFSNYTQEITLPVYYNLSNELLEQVIKVVITAVEKITNP
ncbi:MAG: aminotransferase class I/II-fold pyridoxal phosphate-dependent enzyme [Bacteroidales bacterium]|nr:aminotransferase class I/II-fold pyridoxal phosphate-dependent enzyme [Bacteroidales bacterium]